MFESIRALFSRKPKPVATRSFDAAAGGRRWRDASMTPNLQAAILAGREPVARRARDASINTPLGSSAVDVWVSESVGSGMRPVPQTGDDALDAIILAAWDSWCDRADYFGATNFEGLQAMAAGRWFVDGDWFALMPIESDELRIKALDSAQIVPITEELPNGGLVLHGIEVDNGGKPVAYRIYKNWIPGLPLLRGLEISRVPAADVIHVFKAEAAGQARGISKFASVLLRLRELDALTDGQLVRLKIGALLAGFITDVDGQLLQDAATPGEASLEPGTMQRLRPGESVSFSDPPQIGSESNEFQKALVREIASGVGIPPFLLEGDYGSINFSSARVALIAFRRHIEQWQYSVLVHTMLRPIYRRWLSVEILSGRIADVALNEATLRHKWIAPKGVWVDPLRDSQSEVIGINAGLTSRRECVAARGIDIEALDEEISRDREREKALGIDFAPTPPPAPPTGAPQQGAPVDGN
jgi:lambda family phage portal protein